MKGYSQRVMAMQSSPIRRLQPYALQAVAEGVKVLYGNIGQPDISTPVAFAEGVVNFIKNPQASDPLAYGPSEGLPAFKEAFAAYLRRNGIDISAEQVFATSGASEALLLVLMALCDPGDEIIIPEPFYTNYRTFCAMAGITVVPITLDWDSGFGFPSIEAFEKAITIRTRAILNCSPNNPTGSMFTRLQMKQLLELCVAKNLYLISDEVYREFVYDQEPFSVMQLPQSATHAVMIDSLSKRYSACGARIGMIVSKNLELLQQILKMSQARLCPPTLEQMAAIPLIERSDQDIIHMREIYRSRVKVLCDGLGSIEGVSCHRPKGAFYTMAKLPVDDTDKFAQYMVSSVRLEGKTLLVAPGGGFYLSPGYGQDEVRMAAVMDEESLSVAVKILAKALKSYKG
ncbi:MAG: pyridoxal phosphate-dependent aminotransferase [Sphaerochaetaceae bacterium]|nr:pyridoxal phosphate-dependent aminotransferase [Sphaerochaetaceae bacterium]